MKTHIEIRHPEWLPEVSRKWQKLSCLKLQGRIPASIEGWMFVTDAKYALRAVYGSDLRASWNLFTHDLLALVRNIPRQIRLAWRYRVMMHSPDVDLNRYIDELEQEVNEERQNNEDDSN